MQIVPIYANQTETPRGDKAATSGRVRARAVLASSPSRRNLNGKMLALPRFASGHSSRYGGPLHASRCARPAVRMLSGTPLDFEELQALSGTWRYA